MNRGWKREGMLPVDAVAQLGGHASRRELLALGCDETFIKLSLWYRTILPTRRGWYASRGTPEVLLRALRAGGRLACSSAVAWHEGRAVDEPLHIVVPYGSSRVGRGVLVHWSRREVEVGGNRLVVDEAAARWQAASCRELRASRSC